MGISKGALDACSKEKLGILHPDGFFHIAPTGWPSGTSECKDFHRFTAHGAIRHN
jgi:hypothetical protein